MPWIALGLVALLEFLLQPIFDFFGILGPAHFDDIFTDFLVDLFPILSELFIFLMGIPTCHRVIVPTIVLPGANPRIDPLHFHLFDLLLVWETLELWVLNIAVVFGGVSLLHLDLK